MRVTNGLATTEFYNLRGQIQSDGSFILRTPEQAVLREVGRIEGNTVQATVTGANCNYTLELTRLNT